MRTITIVHLPCVRLLETVGRWSTNAKAHHNLAGPQDRGRVAGLRRVMILIATL